MRMSRQLLRRVISGLVVAFVLAGVFWLGTLVGEIRGSTRALSGPPASGGAWTPWPRFLGHRWSGRHGALGVIESRNGDSLAVRGRSGDVVRVRLTDYTVILKGRDRIEASLLQDQVWIVVIGSPGADGVIDARVIKVLAPDTPSWHRRDGTFRLPPDDQLLNADLRRSWRAGEGSSGADFGGELPDYCGILTGL